jgi:hypothetical protein
MKPTLESLESRNAPSIFGIYTYMPGCGTPQQHHAYERVDKLLHNLKPEVLKVFIQNHPKIATNHNLH